jgi:hypothetical protein
MSLRKFSFGVYIPSPPQSIGLSEHQIIAAPPTISIESAKGYDVKNRLCIMAYGKRMVLL